MAPQGLAKDRGFFGRSLLEILGLRSILGHRVSGRITNRRGAGALESVAASLVPEPASGYGAEHREELALTAIRPEVVRELFVFRQGLFHNVL